MAWWVSKETIAHGVKEGIFLAEGERADRKWRKNKPIVRRKTLNIYETGKPIQVIALDPAYLHCGVVSDETKPTEATVIRTIEHESWLVVFEVDEYWEQKNGRETGKLLRKEFVRVVSKTRTDPWK